MLVHSKALHKVLSLVLIILHDCHAVSYFHHQKQEYFHKTANDSYDKEKVWLCLKKTGLSERVKEMPKGIETVIYFHHQKQEYFHKTDNLTFDAKYKSLFFLAPFH